MKVTRRDLFIWGAGAAAGMVFTPVPWKLLDDVSIWTQNWPWIPQPARGPVEVKQSFCTLCPQGCGMKVRTAAGWPVGIAGMNTHPLTRGALCPLAFGAHQLNWHPQRLRTVCHKSNPASWAEAQSAFVKACGEGPVVIIDGYPGRAASCVLETFAQKRGSYRVAPNPEVEALAPYQDWSGVPASALGYDLENAHTIVSFGAPLLDGWGAPGRLTHLWAQQAAGLVDPTLRLIHVEDSFSRTAARAWKWISIRTGTQAALVAGLARVLIEERLVPARGPMPQLTLAEAADQTGFTEAAIRDLARTIVARPPVLAIANDKSPNIAALNALLGAPGARGGIVRRSKRSRPDATDDLAISNPRAVLIDSTVPWDFVPQTDAEVFRFAAWDGGSSTADWLLPAPGFLEELTDIPSAPTSAIDTYAVATDLLKPSSQVQSAAQFLGNVDPTLDSPEKIIHRRCADLFHDRKGTIYGKEATPVARIESQQKLEEQLRKGAVWTGDPRPPGGWKCALKEWPQGAPAQRQGNWISAWSAPVMPPLASKLYQESGLRETPGRRNA